MRKQHEGYFSFDGQGDNGWGRAFGVIMPDHAAGLLIAEHLTEPSPVFDYRTEMNLAIVCAASIAQAMQATRSDERETPRYPSVIRRLARLMSHGPLIEHFKDTLTERGMERLIVYGEKMNHDTYSIFDRAGFRQETRGETDVRILDL